MLWKTILWGGLLKFFADIFAFTAPIFLNKLITFVSHHEEPMRHGYLYMAGLVLMLFISKNSYFY